MTFDEFGLTKINPNAQMKPTTVTKIQAGFSYFIAVTIPPINKTIFINQPNEIYKT